MRTILKARSKKYEAKKKAMKCIIENVYQNHAYMRFC